MKPTISFFICFSYCFISSLIFASPPLIHHELTVTLNTDQSNASIHDIVTIPHSIIQSTSSFSLSKNSKIKKITFNGKIISSEISADGFLKFKLPEYTETDVMGLSKLVCIYILPLQISNSNMETLFISGEDFFYPQPEIKNKSEFKITFQIKSQTPANIRVVSQGEKLKDSVRNGTRTTIWKEIKPQEEILIVADHYHEFLSHHGSISIYAYLRDFDNALANRYLEAAKFYIDLYSKIIAPYPYKKFALVENSRQTGYGMPSFTLLGSRVIRFPFILHTSYPHEILHNWFGNGVYIHPNSGNWAEGLTSYLADHLLLEQTGKGKQYRFQELMKYSSYINETNDFPLSKFKGSNSAASQAIGYGKMLMVFHMLRLEVGDTIFLKAIRNFYKKNQFRYAGFKEIQASFKGVRGHNLEKFFNQWVSRKGAPKLKLFSASQTPQNGTHLLKIETRQTQSEPTFTFKLPIAIWLTDKQKPQVKNITITDRKQVSLFSFDTKPLKVMLDPNHEVFRRLNSKEVPPNLGKAYGAEITTTLFPESNDHNELLSAYKNFYSSIESRSRPPHINFKDNSRDNDATSNLWVFGKNNKLSQKIKAQLSQYEVKVNEQGVTLDGRSFKWRNNSFVFALSHHNSYNKQIVWLVAPSKKSIPGLIRKLPHYGKYGYLVFKGNEPKNVIKGTWPSSRVGLEHVFIKGTYPLFPKAPLIK
jgi:aminopeptidase N